LANVRLAAKADYTIRWKWIQRLVDDEMKLRNPVTGFRREDPIKPIEHEIAVLRDRIAVVEKAMLAIRRDYLAQIGQ
jgi:hypothetical protein